MTDLYVSTSGSDSNAGTQASPFRTIGHAADAASSGTTVHVAPGTYTGGFQTTTSGVTYVSDVKWGAKIVPGASNGRSEAWDNRGANVTIDGFEIDGSSPQGGTPWRFGVYTAGSDSVVQNVKVHDLVRDSSAWSAANSGGGGGAGIMGDSYYGGKNVIFMLDYERTVANCAGSSGIDPWNDWLGVDGVERFARHWKKANCMFFDGGVRLMDPLTIKPTILQNRIDYWIP